MGSFRTFLVLATGLAIGGALVIAHRVSQETGKSWSESFTDVPGEAKRIYEDLKLRADDAFDRGRQAYHEKQTEMDSYLSGGPVV